jgi:uncharacterized protein YpmS
VRTPGSVQRSEGFHYWCFFFLSLLSVVVVVVAVAVAAIYLPPQRVSDCCVKAPLTESNYRHSGALLLVIRFETVAFELG